MEIERKYTRCRRCNRPLKSEKAQKRGYGGHCYQLHLADVEKNHKTLLDYVDEETLIKCGIK